MPLRFAPAAPAQVAGEARTSLVTDVEITASADGQSSRGALLDASASRPFADAAPPVPRASGVDERGWCAVWRAVRRQGLGARSGGPRASLSTHRSKQFYHPVRLAVAAEAAAQSRRRPQHGAGGRALSSQRSAERQSAAATWRARAGLGSGCSNFGSAQRVRRQPRQRLVGDTGVPVHVLRASADQRGPNGPGPAAERARGGVHGVASGRASSLGEPVFHAGAAAGRAHGRAPPRAGRSDLGAWLRSATVQHASSAFAVSKCPQRAGSGICRAAPEATQPARRRARAGSKRARATGRHRRQATANHARQGGRDSHPLPRGLSPGTSAVYR